MRGAQVSPSGRTSVHLATALLVAAAATAAGAAGDLERIMRALAADSADTVRFVETRHVALLRAPIESAGTLSRGSGGRLEKHTTQPRDEKLIVEGDTVTVARGEQRLSMRLADQPGVRALIDGLRGTLAGDLAALQRHYRVELEGGFDAWRLFLLPRDAQLAELVTDVRITGARGEVRRVEVRETSGDYSVMTLAKARP